MASVSTVDTTSLGITSRSLEAHPGQNCSHQELIRWTEQCPVQYMQTYKGTVTMSEFQESITENNLSLHRH